MSDAFAVPPGGISPFSTGYTNGAAPASAPRNWLADKIDPQTGELVSITEGLHPVDAAVIWAFQVRLGSGPAIGQAGNQFHLIRKLGDRASKEIEFEASRLLEPFIRRGWIELRTGDGIEAEVFGDTASLVVNYWNRILGARQSPRFTVGGSV